MMDPVTAGLIVGGGQLAMGIYDRWRMSDLMKLQEEVLNQQVTFNADLQRRARGKFTDSELAQIKRNAAPQINAVSGNVSARLGPSSPAGIALINQAQQAPVNAAMQAATSQYGQSLARLSASVKGHLGGLQGDNSFIEDLTASLKAWQSLNEKPTADVELAQALEIIGQGYLSSEQTAALKGGYKSGQAKKALDFYEAAKYAQF